MVVLYLVLGFIVLLALVVPLTITRVRRRSGPELEPPAKQLPGEGRQARPGATRPPASRPATRPPTTRPPTAPRTGAPAPQESPAAPPEAPTEVPAELQAEIEAALAPAEPEVVEPEVVEPEVVEAPALEPLVKPRFRDRIGKARALFSGFLSRTEIDNDTWDELEEALILADVGVGLATTVLDDLRSRVKSEGITTADDLIAALKTDLRNALSHADRSLRLEEGETNVWLFVGVNGVGKTTTIGKLGYREALNGRKVVMAAGDTFRAAAAEQLELWSGRAGADIVRGAEGGDPGAVIFDAVQRAASRGSDLVLADTAGRLHTKVNLMEELKKVRRVAERPPGRVSEVLLVIDATTGQNGLTQAKQFADAVDVTGVVLTKLDGTAKGGIALAIETDLGIPIKLVGLGETAADLTAFDPDEFVEALLAP